MDMHAHHHGHDPHGREAKTGAAPADNNPPRHHGHAAAGHDHGAMIADFRRRFWLSAVLTIPILLLSPMIQHWLGLGDRLAFAGSDYALFALSSVVFFYGGWPFLIGLAGEIAKRQPGMMTLIALAIAVAYLFSSAVVFGLPGEPFFWELATLIDSCCWGIGSRCARSWGRRARSKHSCACCRRMRIVCGRTAA